VPDAKVFYGPSARGVKRLDHGTVLQQQNLEDWGTAGGYDRDIMLYGDWKRHIPGWGSDRRYDRYGILGRYTCRYFPLSGLGTGSSTGKQYIWLNNTRMTVHYTMPDVVTDIGCPSFKTPKILKGRALVADMFDKSGGDTDPGIGADVHSDGYNVLYRNDTDKWYSDQERRIIYWDIFHVGDSVVDKAGDNLVDIQPPQRWESRNGLSRDWSMFGTMGGGKYWVQTAMEVPPRLAYPG